jgi:hypothetical protein
MEAWGTVALPGGWWREGVLHRTAFVRPLTGRDEEALLAGAEATLPERASALIARCVGRIGSVDPMTEERAAALTVGDREALLLALRRMTFGEQLQCIFECTECGEAMDIELAIGDLLVVPGAAPAPEYEEAVTTPEGPWRLRYRLPTGADQIAVARGCAETPERGGCELLARCVLDAVAPSGADADPAALPAAVAQTLGERMAALDPQAETELNFACPVCGARSAAVLDAADLFLRELSARGTRLYREVHHLALHYHWSERAILALPHRKRLHYLALLAETLGGEA